VIALLLAASLASPRWVAPSPDLPSGVETSRSNNNLAMTMHDGKLFLAFRSAPVHFAWPSAKLIVLSSKDLGKTWERELVVAPGRDVREPQLVSWQGKLLLYYCELGKNPFLFQPQGAKRATRDAKGVWSAPEATGRPGEMAWEIKARRGWLWKASYTGGHYHPGRSTLELRFERSKDGINWEPGLGKVAVVYTGGVSEASFEFDDKGEIWAVTRNEDGDATGWGSMVARGWRFPAASDPERYDSPRLFRSGGELYLLARRDLGGPYDRGWRRLPFWAQKTLYLFRYWLTPKRTALYKLDSMTGKPVPLLDLPSAGDTAFPAVVEIGDGKFLVGNYTSDPSDGARSWVRGQLGTTSIYLAELEVN
jgi:hypothetical protein